MKPTAMLLCGLIALLGMAVLSFGQITIHSSDVPPVGTTLYHASTEEVTVDLGSGGANQTWDFSDYAYGDDGQSMIVDPSTTSFAGSFPGATHALGFAADTIESWTYARVTSSAAYIMGYAATLGQEDIIFVYDPQGTMFVFPCTYQTSWTSVARWTFGVDFSDSTLYVCDGWGILITPWGSWQVLRIQEHDFSIMYLPPPIGPQVTESYSYSFVTQSGFGALNVTSAAEEPDPNFTQGYIEVTSMSPLAAEPVRGPVAEHFRVGQNYPNPFNPSTTLPVELAKTGPVTLTIYDETGRLVSSEEFELPMGQHNLFVDGANWATGTYFARVTASGQSQTVRMQLVK